MDFNLLGEKIGGKGEEDGTVGKKSH